MNSGGLKRLTIEGQLRRALAGNEFSLQYQPQIDLTTGHVSGLEALLRWNNAELGSVPPLDFIPVAEETGLAPECLEIEITESLFVRDEAGADIIVSKLKAIGVSVAIDDFGTGYSNFGRLRGLSIDRLKIDGSFINQMHSNRDDRALVTAMGKMAKVVGLGVVAEGVEDFNQLLQLQDDRCERAQGFLLSRPLSAADASAFLKRAAENEETSRTLRLRAMVQ